MNVTIPKFSMQTISLAEKKTVDKLIHSFREVDLCFLPLCRIFDKTAYVDYNTVTYELSRNVGLDGYYFFTSKDFDIFIGATILGEQGVIATLRFFLSDYNNFLKGVENADQFLSKTFIKNCKEEKGEESKCGEIKLKSESLFAKINRKIKFGF